MEESLKYVVGIDEAGRGPLAGPVAVGLVRAPEGFDVLTTFPGLNDSKKLSEKKRELLFGILDEQVATGNLLYEVIFRSAQDIDSRGIAVVIREAVGEGLEKLLPDNVHIVNSEVKLDGALRAPSHYFQQTIIKGDSLIPEIMLASIAAKVLRDRLMTSLHDTYLQYNFAKHKGYGTKAHLDALRTHGLCDIHRRSFIHIDQA